MNERNRGRKEGERKKGRKDRYDGWMIGREEERREKGGREGRRER